MKNLCAADSFYSLDADVLDSFYSLDAEVLVVLYTMCPAYARDDA